VHDRGLVLEWGLQRDLQGQWLELRDVLEPDLLLGHLLLDDVVLLWRQLLQLGIELLQREVPAPALLSAPGPRGRSNGEPTPGATARALRWVIAAMGTRVPRCAVY